MMDCTYPGYGMRVTTCSLPSYVQYPIQDVFQKLFLLALRNGTTCDNGSLLVSESRKEKFTRLP